METSDLLVPVSTPRAATMSSPFRVGTPGEELEHDLVQGEIDAAAWLDQDQAERTPADSGILTVRLRWSLIRAWAGAVGGALVWGCADDGGGLGIDEGVEHDAEHLTHAVSGA